MGAEGGGSFAGDPECYVEMALEMGISLNRTPMGNLEGGSFTRDFERWMKVAVEVEHLSLRALFEGNLGGGGSSTGDPGRCVKEGSVETGISP